MTTLDELRDLILTRRILAEKTIEFWDSTPFPPTATIPNAVTLTVIRGCDEDLAMLALADRCWAPETAATLRDSIARRYGVELT